jgi:hypothetical protein
MAKRICGTADRFDPTGMPRPRCRVRRMPPPPPAAVVSLPPNSLRAAPPIYPHLIFDRHAYSLPPNPGRLAPRICSDLIFDKHSIPCENWPVKVGGRPRWQCGGGSPAGPSRRVPGAGTPLSVMLDAGMSGTGRNARLGRSFLWLEHRGKGPAPDRLDRGRPWAPPPVISDLGVPPGHQRSRRGRQL